MLIEKGDESTLKVLSQIKQIQIYLRQNCNNQRLDFIRAVYQFLRLRKKRDAGAA